MDGPSQKDPASNGCLSTLLVKIILHIFCMSVTVSIKPRPFDSEGEEGFFCCGFPYEEGEEKAEESRGRRCQHCPPLPRLPGSGLCQPIQAQAATPANQSELGQSLASQSELRQSPANQSELRRPAVPASGRVRSRLWSGAEANLPRTC